MKNTKKVMVGSLNTDIKAKLFQLHVMDNPRGTEVSFYKKFVPVVTLNLARVKETSLLMEMTAEEEARYLSALQVRATRFPAVSGGRLLDGLRRLSVAKRNGLDAVDVLDFSRFIKPERSSYRIKINVS